MFTGLIDHGGKVVSSQVVPDGLDIAVRTRFSHVQLGESIAVNGVCLTVTAVEDDTVAFSLSTETLRCTAARWSPGEVVHLERALRLQDRLGGHVVTGHVDDVAVVVKRVQHSDYLELHFTAPLAQVNAYCIDKGSVALNGVSLTLNSVVDDTVSVMLIPHTLAVTSLGELAVGDQVNIEYDPMAKLIAKHMAHYHKNMAGTPSPVEVQS